MHPESSQQAVGHSNRWLDRGVVGIGSASFFADAGHEIASSLLPSFFTAVLGAPASVLGVVEGVVDGLGGAARLAGGALADDPQRRRTTAVGGYASTAVFTGLIAATTASWQAGALRTAAWITRGLRVPARNALLADAAPPSHYGRAYGFERAMDNLGAIVGPLLALALVAVVGIRGAIALSVIPGMFAVFAIAYAVRHIRHPTRAKPGRLRLRVRAVVHGELGRLLAAIAVFEVGNVAATLLILRATDLFEPGQSSEAATQLAIALYLIYNCVAALASVPAGRVADRATPVAVLAFGFAAFAAAYTGFAFVGASFLLLALCFSAAGVAVAAVETAEHAAVAALADEDVRGSAFGVLAALQSFGNFVASSVTGVLYALVSPTVAFLIPATAMLAALLVLVAAGGRHLLLTRS